MSVFSFNSLRELLKDSLRLKVLLGGLLISSFFFLLTFVVLSSEQLATPITEILGKSISLWHVVQFFRAVVGICWSIFVFYLLQIRHPGSLYQQGKAAFLQQQQKGYGYGRTFFRTYASSEPFRQFYGRLCFLLGLLAPYLVPLGYQYAPLLFLLGWSSLTLLAFFLVREERATPLPEGEEGYVEYPDDLAHFVQQHIIVRGKQVVVVGVGLGATVGLATVGNTWVSKYYSYHENTKISEDKVKISENKTKLSDNQLKFSENQRQIAEYNFKASENYRKAKELESKRWPWS